MFIIYHSNRADLFKKFLIKTMLNKPLSDPMQSEIILTEYSNIIDQWIQLELAKHCGIVLNIRFMTVTDFMQNLFNNIVDNSFITYKISRSTMYWKFMEILSDIQVTNNLFIVQKYLRNDINQLKVSQFAEQLVELFIQYLIYRPDWLDSWKSNKTVKYLDNTHQFWQAKIWRIFLKHVFHNQQELNNKDFLKRCIYRIKNIQKINLDFPNRIFIFGITSIPPIYWKILKILSHHVDIYLWFINPCTYNWINESNMDSCIIMQKKDRLNSNNKSLLHAYIFDHDNFVNCNSNYHINMFHPLLKAWGGVGLNTLSVLNQLKNIIELKSFILPKKDSLLHIVQKDIFGLYKNIIDASTQCDITTLKFHGRYALALKDKSITFHVCHSIQREVEILHDNLLSMMIDNPILSPGDIVVMAADIHCYRPAIQTVFNTQGRRLPFTIACNLQKKIHPIILTFLNIINLPCIRFTAEEILACLTVPSVANRFQLNKEEVKFLHKWTVESGIRWGLDEITMRNLDLPITNKNTWYFGLNRMLLGYAIKNQYETWEEITPAYDNINTENYNAIGQLGEFLKTLKKWRDRFTSSYTLKKWVSYFKEIIDDFFYCDHTDTEEDKIIFFLKNCCLNTLKSGIQVNYAQTISITALRNKLYNRLTKSTVAYQFLPNVINFCNISPVHCIPHKIVCFLGMNDSTFPRNKEFPDFNLIAKNPRKNDDNLYNKDCYAFLLTFLLAQERVYISFLGYSIYDNRLNHPSVLIDVLFEYITQNFYFTENKNIDIDINIQCMRQNLCKWHDPFPFSPKNFNFIDHQQSFADEWLSAAYASTRTSLLADPNFYVPISKKIIKKITFQDLYNFYRHPVRMWFQKRLNVFFDYKTTQLLNNEPFSVDGLDRYELNVKLVDYLIHNKDTNKLYKSISASGILPYGVFGELFWIKQHEKMTILANKIKEYYIFEKYNLDIFLEFDTLKLVGELMMVQKNGLIRWTPRHLSMKYVLLLWLEHITYCAMGGQGDSRLFSIDNVWHFPNFSISHAKQLLSCLILGYCNGINVPIFLLFQSGGAWINHVFDWNTRTISLDQLCQKKARKKLIQTWKGTEYSFFKESNDPYLRKIIPFDLSSENITKITETAEHYFLNAMKYRII